MLKYFHTFIASPPFYDVYGFDVCCRERSRGTQEALQWIKISLTLFSNVFLWWLYSQKQGRYKTIVAHFFSFCFLFDFPWHWQMILVVMNYRRGAICWAQKGASFFFIFLDSLLGIKFNHGTLFHCCWYCFCHQWTALGINLYFLWMQKKIGVKNSQTI